VDTSGTALADFWLQVGRYDDAQLHFERAKIIQERTLGPYHTDVAATLVGLAALLKRSGQTAEAVALYERALAIRQHSLDADHPEIAEVRQALADLGVALK
jgi:tetratricopeptide (TPR) repeat protein